VYTDSVRGKGWVQGEGQCTLFQGEGRVEYRWRGSVYWFRVREGWGRQAGTVYTDSVRGKGWVQWGEQYMYTGSELEGWGTEGGTVHVHWF